MIIEKINMVTGAKEFVEESPRTPLNPPIDLQPDPPTPETLADLIEALVIKGVI
jgi:hypothetical protein